MVMVLSTSLCMCATLCACFKLRVSLLSFIKEGEYWHLLNKVLKLCVNGHCLRNQSHCIMTVVRLYGLVWLLLHCRVGMYLLVFFSSCDLLETSNSL